MPYNPPTRENEVPPHVVCIQSYAFLPAARMERDAHDSRLAGPVRADQRPESLLRHLQPFLVTGIHCGAFAAENLGLM